jgi:hypothetical protein
MSVLRALVLGAFSFLACLSLGSVAMAEDYRLAPDAEDEEGGFELTPWLRLHPFARTTMTYTSNLLREPNRLKQSETFFQGIIGADLVLAGDGRSFEGPSRSAF